MRGVPYRLVRHRGLLGQLVLACGCLGSARVQFVIDSRTTKNGLPQNSAMSIRQTPDGYLWLTTFDGLARFDGMDFTIFNKINTAELTSNRFVYLFSEVVTEDSGVVRYRDGRFQVFTKRNRATGLLFNRSQHLERFRPCVSGRNSGWGALGCRKGSDVPTGK
jgi:hypothetical protein